MIRVYKYGLLKAIENDLLVRQQMRAAHRYRNTLTQIERGRREALRAAEKLHGNLPALSQTLAAADRDLEVAIGVVRRERARSRTRSETPAQAAAVKAARAVRKTAAGALRQARQDLRASGAMQTESDRINELAAELRRSARAYCGVYWGSYLLVEDAESRARKMPLYDGVEVSDPRFVNFEGEGRIGVQIQGGMTVAEALGGQDARLRVERIEDRKRGLTASRFARLHVRVGSAGPAGREPVWAVFPCKLHRPLPPAARIKWTTVQVRRIAAREEWTVCFTLELPDEAIGLRPERAVAVDVGWRQLDGDLRVAVAIGTDGQREELRLPAKLLGGYHKSEELRSLRDTKFNLVRDAFVSWLAKQRILPAWLHEATRTLGEWRSTERLARFVWHWHRVGWTTLEERQQLAELEVWRAQDEHLRKWECEQRLRSLRHRQDLFKVWAWRLADRYETLVLEAFDLRVFAHRSDQAENETARSNRQLAGASFARTHLVSAFGAERVVRIDATNTTRTCSTCGLVADRGAAESVVLHCECGATFDQDDNADANLLQRWREQDGVPPEPGGARSNRKESEDSTIEESKWQKVKRLQDEKKVRRGGARKAEQNAAE